MTEGIPVGDYFGVADNAKVLIGASRRYGKNQLDG
jgi:hypothetical protein